MKIKKLLSVSFLFCITALSFASSSEQQIQTYSKSNAQVGQYLQIQN